MLNASGKKKETEREREWKRERERESKNDKEREPRGQILPPQGVLSSLDLILRPHGGGN